MDIRPAADHRHGRAQHRRGSWRWCALVVGFASTLAACGGGGGDGGDGGEPPPSPSPGPAPGPDTSIVVSGKATYDSVPARVTGLDYAATTKLPIRGATVLLLDASDATLATTTTDAEGAYSFTSASPVASARVRVVAEVKGTGHDFAVRDNTNAGSLYAVESAPFALSATTTQDMHAASGWNGSAYTSDVARVAGPFAILDVAYLTKQKVLGAIPGATLEPLALYWSPKNVIEGGDPASGRIGFTGFLTVQGSAPALYILGDEDDDTDEYDTAVVAREIGRYVQYALSRSDEIGTPRSSETFTSRFDMRLAFSEGWANAFSSMVRDAAEHVDTRGPGQAAGSAFTLADAPSLLGWYSVPAVQHLLWSDYQDAAIGFDGVIAALESMRTAPVFASVFSYQTALRAARPSAATGIVSRAVAAGVTGSDAYGSGETNDGGVAAALPVYGTHDVALGSAKTYCISADAGIGNKLGNFTFVRFSASGTRTITVSKSATTLTKVDPEVTLVTAVGARSTFQSAGETETLANVELQDGTHVLTIKDYEQLQVGSATRCFDVTIN